MAPKGGKGGGGGGGGGSRGKGASCSACTAPLELTGSDWESSLIIARLAIDVIVALVLIASMLLQTRFKWQRDLAVDKLRNSGFYIAASSLFVAYLIYIVDIVLREEEHTTTRLYYLTYIVSSIFWRIADLLILGIIYRTIAESSQSNLARKLSPLHKILIIILAILSITALGMYIALIVDSLRASGSSSTTTRGYTYVGLAYQALYLLAALLAGVESLTVMLRARSKATLLMLTIVAPALVIHSLFILINDAVTFHYAQGWDTDNVYYLRLACLFIADLTNIFIYGGVILIGFLSFRKGATKSGKYVGGSANGQYDTSYQPVHNSGWGR